MTKRSDGDGGIDQRGENNFRLRYRIGKKRFQKTFHGTLADAKKQLRALLRSGDTGEHVAPDRATLAGWAEQWIAIGCPGRSRQAVGYRGHERYEQVLRMHILPTLGDFKLQDIDGVEIDKLYAGLEGKIAPRSARQVHSVLGALLATAMRTKKIAINPMNHITKTSSAGESDHGVALDDEQLRKLVQGFKGNQLYGIVSVAAFTGMRRNEILALRWSDLDLQKKTLKIERAIEETKSHGLRFKGPKKESHKRTITIDDDLLALLLAERDKHLRLVAGVPEGVAVDLGLVRLPEGALMFPNLIGGDLTTPRFTRQTSTIFIRKAVKLGFKGLRFHDLRRTHETLLLDNGVPVHVVAARCGHDPPRCLGLMSRGHARPTHRQPASSAAFQGVYSGTDSNWVQIGSKFTLCSLARPIKPRS